MSERDDRLNRAAEIATCVEVTFPGTSAATVRLPNGDDTSSPREPAVLVRLPGATVSVGPGLHEDHEPGTGGFDHEELALPSQGREGMPEGVAARCALAIARAQVLRAEEDLVVVTVRLPGPPEQQAEARARLAAAEREALVKEAEVIAGGYERR